MGSREGSRELWPPLEDVRVWAADKMLRQTAPVATRKVQRLVALIDEVLAAKAEARAAEEMQRHQDQGSATPAH